MEFISATVTVNSKKTEVGIPYSAILYVKFAEKKQGSPNKWSVIFKPEYILELQKGFKVKKADKFEIKPELVNLSYDFGIWTNHPEL